MNKFLLLLLVCTQTAFAQVPESPALKSSSALSELEGIYDYRDGATLAMVATGKGLVSVIGEAKYPLRAIAADTFANGAGDRIPFMRAADGHVVAFQERGDTFARRALTVPASIRQLLVARPTTQDGRSPVYSYV